jgi:hypothetical protein
VAPKITEQEANDRRKPHKSGMVFLSTDYATPICKLHL